MTFAEVMFGAHRVVCALESQGGSRPSRAAVRDANRAFRQLLDYQKNCRLTTAEAAVLQTALDVLWKHLRSVESPAKVSAS